MASEQDHLVQAQHNTLLAETLAQELRFKDWIATITFYAALHYVEAMFSRDRGWEHRQTQG